MGGYLRKRGWGWVWHHLPTMHACELSWPKIPFSNINWSNFFSFITDFKFIPTKICIHKHEIFSGLLILLIQMCSVFLLNQYFTHKYFSESSNNRCKSCFGSSFSQVFCNKLFLKFCKSHRETHTPESQFY